MAPTTDPDRPADQRDLAAALVDELIRQATGASCGTALATLVTLGAAGNLTAAKAALVAGTPQEVAPLGRSRDAAVRAAWVTATSHDQHDGPLHGNADRIAVHRHIASSGTPLHRNVVRRLDVTDLPVAIALVVDADLPVATGRQAAETIGACHATGQPIPDVILDLVAATPHLLDAALTGVCAANRPAGQVTAAAHRLLASRVRPLALLSVPTAAALARITADRLRALPVSDDPDPDPAVQVATNLLNDRSTPAGVAAALARTVARHCTAPATSPAASDGSRLALVGLHSTVKARYATQTRVGLSRDQPMTNPTVDLALLARQLQRPVTFTDAVDHAVSANEMLLLSAVVADRQFTADHLARIPAGMRTPALAAAALHGDTDDLEALRQVIAATWAVLHPSLTSHRHGREIIVDLVTHPDTTPVMFAVLAISPLLEANDVLAMPAAAIGHLIAAGRSALLWGALSHVTDHETLDLLACRHPTVPIRDLIDVAGALHRPRRHPIS